MSGVGHSSVVLGAGAGSLIAFVDVDSLECRQAIGN